MHENAVERAGPSDGCNEGGLARTSVDATSAEASPVAIAPDTPGLTETVTTATAPAHRLGAREQPV